MSAPTQRQSGTAERPLPPAARASLVLAAALTMLAFYAVALLLIPLLLSGLLVLAVVLVGAARFGIARFVTPMMQPPSNVLTILLRQLWLPAPVEYCIPLSQSDAPRFFAMAADLAR